MSRRRERPAPGEVELAAPPGRESPPTVPASLHHEAAKEGGAAYAAYNDEDEEQEEAVISSRDIWRSCGFRFIPAGYSDLKPATVPI